MNPKSFFMSHERQNGSGNDWDHIVAPAEPTKLQQLASKTHGIVTPGNGVTIVGLAGIETGAHLYRTGHETLGTILVAIFSAADGVDGAVAAKTDTRGNVGAALDATADKIAGASILGSLVHTGDIPKPLAAGIAITQAAIVAENIRITQRGGEPNPNWNGKIAAFALKAAGASYMIAGALKEHKKISSKVREGFRIAGHVTAVGAIACGGIATMQYHQEANSLIDTQLEAE